MGFQEWVGDPRRIEEGWRAIPLTAEQKAALANLVDKYTAEMFFQPREIAGLTPAEQAMAENALRVVRGGAPGVEDAMKVLKQRMTGPVEQVPGLEGLFTKTRELGADLMGRTKRGLALTGNRPTESSRGEKVMGRTLQDIMEGLVTAAYPFYAQGLAGKQAAPMQLASMGTQDVATRTAAAAGPGSAPRMIEQAILDAILEAMRKTQTFPYDVQVPIAQGILNQIMYAWDPGMIAPSGGQNLLSSMQLIQQGVGAARGMPVQGGGQGGGGYGANIQYPQSYGASGAAQGSMYGATNQAYGGMAYNYPRYSY